MLGRVRDLHAVERLAVLGVGLAADVVRHAGLGHQVAFVGGVDEHRPAKDPAAFHADVCDGVPSLSPQFFKSSRSPSTTARRPRPASRER